MKKKKGFTLIELLVVIGIISVLTGIVIVAVSPARQMSRARNVKRQADVLTYLNAIHQYFIETGGWPNMSTSVRMIGNASTAACNVANCDSMGGAITNGCVNDWFLNALIPTYITGLTFDPFASTNTTASITGYAVKKDASDRVTVGACNAESVGGTAVNIFVTR